MNALTNPQPEFGNARRRALRVATLDLSNSAMTAAPAQHASANQSQMVDCRLAALRVLALTLLSEIEALESSNSGDISQLNLQREVHRFETELIRNALVSTGGRQRRAAKLLGMKVTTLNTKIRRYQIEIA
jgi:transcriptional regulator with GAF, ATPase, and Fis domain